MREHNEPRINHILARSSDADGCPDRERVAAGWPGPGQARAALTLAAPGGTRPGWPAGVSVAAGGDLGLGAALDRLLPTGYLYGAPAGQRPLDHPRAPRSL